jgi:hypothetical protein
MERGKDRSRQRSPSIVTPLPVHVPNIRSAMDSVAPGRADGSFEGVDRATIG